MKADAASFNFLAKEDIVRIPFFQRGYVWTKPNWEELLTDLLDDKKNHFLGSLILKQVNLGTGKGKEALVIDGQQRITTLSVLTKVIFDLFPDSLQAICKPDMEACLFYKENRTDENAFIKIQHSRVDSESYKQAIEGNIYTDLSSINDKSNGILKCYKYLYEELQMQDLEVRKSLFNRLLDKDNKILVLIDLSLEDDEQSIFDTINSSGVRLSSADIIKNSLFQSALDLCKSPGNKNVYENSDVINLYKSCWDEVFTSDEDAITFWSSQRQTGRLRRDNIEILLHSILVIKGIFDPDKHTLSNISALYKEHFKALDKDGLFEFAKLIKEYANIYREKIACFDKSSLFTFEDQRTRLLHILEVCEISTFHPYLLLLFREFGNNEAEINAKLLELEKLVIRRLISKAETKNYNKICKELINNSELAATMLSEVSNEQFFNGLKNITNGNAALVLFWVELNRRFMDSKQSLKELKYNYTLEHVMPQKWVEYWSAVGFVDESGVPQENTDEAKNKRNAYVYSVGNMTLLNSALNTSIRNYDFDHKMNGEGKKKGIKDYADLSITKQDIVKPYENGDHVWNEQKIHDRTKKLYEEMIAIW